MPLSRSRERDVALPQRPEPRCEPRLVATRNVIDLETFSRQVVVEEDGQRLLVLDNHDTRCHGRSHSAFGLTANTEESPFGRGPES